MLTRPQGVLAATLNEEDLYGHLASDQPLVSVVGDGRVDKTSGDLRKIPTSTTNLLYHKGESSC